MSRKISFSRRQVIKALLGLGMIAGSNRPIALLARESADSPDALVSPIIHASSDLEQREAWRMRLKDWREKVRQILRYDDSRYRESSSSWTSSSFSSCFLMLYDQTFVDPVHSQYKVEEFLSQAQEDFGGFDSIILWHAYPRIGMDDRNQFDFYRDMPGGLAGIRDVVRRCHRLGVKAFVVYKPWDVGTRRETVSDIEALAILVKETEADGVYLDTMPEAPEGLRALLDEIDSGLVLEGEGALPLNRVHDHLMSWAQHFDDGEIPVILRNKWFERRHMMHQTARWQRDRHRQLQTAWMNGSGMVVWEVVFGSWVGWSARDRAILRTMLPIQRHFAGLFSGEGWTPLVQTEAANVYATLWDAKGVRLWTLVNRQDQPISGLLLKIPAMKHAAYYDVVTGEKLDPQVEKGEVLLQGKLASHGIGGFVTGAPETLGPDFEQLMMRQRNHQSSVYLPADFPQRHVMLLGDALHYGGEVEPALADMVKIPSASFTMRVQLRTRECGFYGNEIEKSELSSGLNKPRAFERRVTVQPYAIDLTLITNAQYEEFLRASGYTPQFKENFLKHWTGGNVPAGKGDHPVVYVSLDDARAYARWSKKAIPSEEQWQYAAQGPEGLLYPWGNRMEPGRCNGGEYGGTTSVRAYPTGRSPFGCYDMCGNVWEWTESERTDGRTRFCMIRGGSYYTAQGSHWYMDGGPQPADFAAKFLLIWPGLDRCATIGFRCVTPLQE
ncbi:MAG: SUMF1/EgtB/PvdO family nonheme iron enzyme [Nitrospira sp.]|nr:SUMF1/EgtB/PvdO family nonheme iron enzyme [Nitrospira sp.]MBX7038882.1 SUMF1/EgtB/PvdO family nonheme iron enzyme [Nitrospira sp.]MCW5794077.1 SUMF1/EgtB/PvdO family nonheme iron enzyme [Nitrospira sp.]HMU28951.1 SUMF1/EgtB/PvdO family nonheme iron enzyme [Nitrospira sp.]HMV58210.1 SUMF1/EgtB/PvdO family nonheme iron enzyme [Nitrospira sp.]